MERLRLTPARAWILVVGGLMVAALVAAGTLNLASWLGRITEVQHAAYRPSGDRLTLSTSSGDIRLVGDSGDTVRVTTTIRYGLWKPTVNNTSGPDGIRLDAHCHNFDGYCDVSYQILMPRGLNVDLSTSSGNVNLARVTGDVVVKASSGDLVLADLSGATVTGSTSSGNIKVANVTSSQVSVQTKSGDVRGIDLANRQLAARTSSGNITLTLATLPDAVTARASSGDISVAVPPSEDGYQVTSSTSSGDSTIKVPRNDLSARHLDLHTSSGNIRVTPTSG